VYKQRFSKYRNLMVFVFYANKTDVDVSITSFHAIAALLFRPSGMKFEAYGLAFQSSP